MIVVGYWNSMSTGWRPCWPGRMIASGGVTGGLPLTGSYWIDASGLLLAGAGILVSSLAPVLTHDRLLVDILAQRLTLGLEDDVG